MAAQGVHGDIYDEEIGRTVEAAEISLVDARGNVVARGLTNAAGEFRIQAAAGTFTLRVTRIGYESVDVTQVSIADQWVGPLRIRLVPDAVSLPGLTVETKARVRPLALSGFYERMEKGFGDFIEVDNLMRIQKRDPTDLVRALPGISTGSGVVRSRRGAMINGRMQPCPLAVVVDDIYMGIDMDAAVTVAEIEAIEVYNGPSNVPARWRAATSRGYMTRNGATVPTCGVVVVWTRR